MACTVKSVKKEFNLHLMNKMLSGNASLVKLNPNAEFLEIGGFDPKLLTKTNLFSRSLNESYKIVSQNPNANPISYVDASKHPIRIHYFTNEIENLIRIKQDLAKKEYKNQGFIKFLFDNFPEDRRNDLNCKD